LIGYRESIYSEPKLGVSAIDISEMKGISCLPLAIDLIEHVGEPGYAGHLTASLADTVDLAHVAVLSFSGGIRPSLLASHSLLSPTVAKQTAYRYLDHYYRVDPMDRLRAQPVNTRKFLFAQRQRAQDIVDPAYRSSCYERSGIVDRMSFFQRFGADDWIAVNVYRDASQGWFDANDCSRLVAMAGLLTASANKHRRLLLDQRVPKDESAPDHGAFERRLATVGPTLSKREFEVCLEMLAGRTAKEIARRLNIAPTSVATHRQNAYKKLNIRDHKQLFSLVLA
jgi:DNA-binding CsgD family transcriptional regulator